MGTDWKTKLTGGPITRSPAPGKAGKKEYQSIVEHAEHLKFLQGKGINGKSKKRKKSKKVS